MLCAVVCVLGLRWQNGGYALDGGKEADRDQGLLLIYEVARECPVQNFRGYLLLQLSEFWRFHRRLSHSRS